MIALGCDHGGYELMQEEASGRERTGVQRFWMQWSGICRLSCLWKESSTGDRGW